MPEVERSVHPGGGRHLCLPTYLNNDIISRGLIILLRKRFTLRSLIVMLACIITMCSVLNGPVWGGFVPRVPAAPLDQSLMAFKEQGVWYYLCSAPVYPCRIPPHYLTFGPPPPHYCPPPCAPAPVPCSGSSTMPRPVGY
jgi:hypothetical protein